MISDTHDPDVQRALYKTYHVNIDMFDTLWRLLLSYEEFGPSYAEAERIYLEFHSA